MTALTWDAVGTRSYETGVDHGALYVYDKTQNILNCDKMLE